MLMDLATLRTELGVRLKTPNTLSSDQRDRWLNLAQIDVAGSLGPANLMTTTQFTSVPGTYKYLPPVPFARIVSVSNVTNNRPVYNATVGQIELWDPARTQSGSPYRYYTYGLEFCRNQPGAAGTVSIVSTDATDTTQKVRIRGISSGVERTELITLNGTTPVAGTISWDVPTSIEPTIFTVTKNNTTAGVVTVSRGSVTLCIFGPTQKYEERQPFYLYPIPDSADVYQIRGYRLPRPMVSAEDYPDMPGIYHELVVIGAVIRGHRALFRYKEAQQTYNEEWLPKFNKFNEDQSSNRSTKSPVIAGERGDIIYLNDYTLPEFVWDY